MKSFKRKLPAAFTLVELLAVIVIIMLLFGMVLGGLKLAGDKQKNEQTRVQLARIANGLEEYKMDKGLYPATPDGDGSRNSNVLFQKLYWDSNDDGNGADGDDNQKIYLSELDPKNMKLKWLDGSNPGNYKIVDAWGKEIYYRSGKDESGNSNNSTTNDDFDLWSSGKDGGTKPDPNNKENRDDVKAH